jgi:hypothetical protein
VAVRERDQSEAEANLYKAGRLPDNQTAVGERGGKAKKYFLDGKVINEKFRK